jgi:hypothetical protein
MDQKIIFTKIWAFIVLSLALALAAETGGAAVERPFTPMAGLNR